MNSSEWVNKLFNLGIFRKSARKFQYHDRQTLKIPLEDPNYLFLTHKVCKGQKRITFSLFYAVGFEIKFFGLVYNLHDLQVFTPNLSAWQIAIEIPIAANPKI